MNLHFHAHSKRFRKSRCAASHVNPCDSTRLASSVLWFIVKHSCSHMLFKRNRHMVFMHETGISPGWRHLAFITFKLEMFWSIHLGRLLLSLQYILSPCTLTKLTIWVLRVALCVCVCVCVYAYFTLCVSVCASMCMHMSHIQMHVHSYTSLFFLYGSEQLSVQYISTTDPCET